jgi:nucleoside-diphosphate-sugar epimerase
VSGVLVTGATGFVGAHLVRWLLEHGVSAPRCLARPGSDRSSLSGLPVDWREADLARPASLEGACQGVEVVYHCACAVRGTFAAGPAAEAAFRSVNVEGTLALATEALRCGVRRFVHVSSTAAMGSPPGGVVDESTPCQPTTPYGRSKRDAELGLLDLFATQGLPVVILRPCLVTGPGRRNPELARLFALCRRGLFPLIGGKASQRKPLVHVADVAQALELAARSGRPGEIYLITSGEPYALEQVVAMASDLVGGPRRQLRVPLPLARATAALGDVLGRLRIQLPLTGARLRLLLADRELRIDKARRELGYEPRFSELRGLLASGLEAR